MHNGILIISHKRPQCITVQTLKNAGYDGEWFIVADDEDDTDYEKLYTGHVIRFSKEKYAQEADTADNFGKRGLPTYARNACYDIAQEKGYDVFGLFDDDLKGFHYRYVNDGKLAGKGVKKFGRIFDAYCKFILQSGFACGGFISAGKLLGGAKNPFVMERFYYNPTNALIINLNVEHYRFCSAVWEDCVYAYRNNAIGKFVAGFMPIVVTTAEPGAMEPGGCTEMYRKQSEYVRECYAKIIIPTFMKWTSGCKKHRFSSDIPRILNERWRKEQP